MCVDGNATAGADSICPSKTQDGSAAMIPDDLKYSTYKSFQMKNLHNENSLRFLHHLKYYFPVFLPYTHTAFFSGDAPQRGQGTPRVERIADHEQIRRKTDGACSKINTSTKSANLMD